MNQIFSVFDSILTFVLGVSVPNIKSHGLLIGTSLFRRVPDAPLQFQSSKSFVERAAKAHEDMERGVVFGRAVILAYASISPPLFSGRTNFKMFW